MLDGILDRVALPLRIERDRNVVGRVFNVIAVSRKTRRHVLHRLRIGKDHVAVRGGRPSEEGVVFDLKGVGAQRLLLVIVEALRLHGGAYGRRRRAVRQVDVEVDRVVIRLPRRIQIVIRLILVRRDLRARC